MPPSYPSYCLRLCPLGTSNGQDQCYYVYGTFLLLLRKEVITWNGMKRTDIDREADPQAQGFFWQWGDRGPPTYLPLSNLVHLFSSALGFLHSDWSPG